VQPTEFEYYVPVVENLNFQQESSLWGHIDQFSTNNQHTTKFMSRHSVHRSRWTSKL